MDISSGSKVMPATLQEALTGKWPAMHIGVLHRVVVINTLSTATFGASLFEGSNICSQEDAFQSSRFICCRSVALLLKI